MATSEVLQEYLVKLGYAIDGLSLKKFIAGQELGSKSLIKTSAAAAGMIAAVEAASMAYAYSMRKMYFASELSNTSVLNLKAMAFAGKQAGISTESMGDALAHAGAMMRNLPQRLAFEGLTKIKTQGKGADQVLTEFLAHMKQMEKTNPMLHQLGASWAQTFFGMSEEDYTLGMRHLGEMQKAKQEMIDMYKQVGVDPESAKKTTMAYTKELDKLESHLGAVGMKLMQALQPDFMRLTKWANEFIDAMEPNIIEFVHWLEELTPKIDAFIEMLPGSKNKTERAVEKYNIGTSSKTGAQVLEDIRKEQGGTFVVPKAIQDKYATDLSPEAQIAHFISDMKKSTGKTTEFGIGEYRRLASEEQERKKAEAWGEEGFQQMMKLSAKMDSRARMAYLSSNLGKFDATLVRKHISELPAGLRDTYLGSTPSGQGQGGARTTSVVINNHNTVGSMAQAEHVGNSTANQVKQVTDRYGNAVRR